MKKNKSKDLPIDLKGFEEYIEAQGDDFPQLKTNQKKDTPVENITFLLNETKRLKKQKKLFNDQIRIIEKFDQSEQLVDKLTIEIEKLKNQLWEISAKKDSPFQTSMSEIFDPFFKKGSN